MERDVVAPERKIKIPIPAARLVESLQGISEFKMIQTGH